MNDVRRDAYDVERGLLVLVASVGQVTTSTSQSLRPLGAASTAVWGL